VTRITDGHVPDQVYEEIRPHFSEKELADLTPGRATINAWNRLAIASRTEPGKYQPTKMCWVGHSCPTPLIRLVPHPSRVLCERVGLVDLMS